MNETPLVSILVLSYNSKKTILETLNSIYEQTYPRLELIISDDCSTDGTISVCKAWLKDHCARFENNIIIESPANTGISPNCNRGESACSGKWLKIIAGDDLLFTDAIEKLVTFSLVNPEAICICGNVQAFGGDSQLTSALTSLFSDRTKKFQSLSNSELLDLFINGNTPPAPGLFYDITAFRQAGVTYDERIPLINDVPHWINILRAGIKIFFPDILTVYYRVGNGISTSESWQSPLVYKNRRLLYFLYQWDYLYHLDKESVINSVVNEEYQIYNQLQKERQRYNALYNSVSHKIGRFIVSPAHIFKRLLTGSK